MLAALGTVPRLCRSDHATHQRYGSLQQTAVLVLNILFIAGNSINDVYVGVPHWTLLETLDVEGNKLIEIPREVMMLSRLHELMLSRNFLSDLPFEASALTNLTTLSLDSNKFKVVPECLSRMVRYWLKRAQILISSDNALRCRSRSSQLRTIASKNFRTLSRPSSASKSWL